jgi:Ca2+:H+ antiporter
MADADVQTPTGHKEYSVILAAAAGAVLFLVDPASGVPELVLLNCTAIASILYSAFSVVRHADVLAHRYGEPYGSLILSLSIVILEVGMIATLMLTGAAGPTMMRDTIYSVIIIVMSGLIGLSLFLGGLRHRSQNFNFRGIKHYLMSITPLALIVLALPTALGGESLGTPQLAVIALACAFVYYMFLRIQTVTHRKFFLHEHEDGDDSGHGMPSRHSTPRHFLFLGIHLVAVIGITKMNSYPLEQLLKLADAPPALAGFLVALLILSPESAAALGAVMRNQAQRAMNLMLGAVLTTISLTVPVVVSIAALSGQDITLGLSVPNILLLIATLLLCQTSLTGGKTNAHSGSAHLIIFAVYIMLIFG